ncbi:ribosome silencing factor [Oscillospiraceae bacterium OttesenSCG-928-G22]|nr:ribosome silencing factor [Oscillospiraceae bacterium OttesenSCG-928-G22]
MTSRELTNEILKILDDKKVQDLSALDIGALTVLSDFFVVCTGTSDRHVRTLADAVSKELKDRFDIYPHHIEGYESLTWVLLDYNGVVVHIFQQETRELYNIERLWSDAPKLDLTGIVSATPVS